MLPVLEETSSEEQATGSQQGFEWYCLHPSAPLLFPLFSLDSAQCHSMEGFFYFFRQCSRLISNLKYSSILEAAFELLFWLPPPPKGLDYRCVMLVNSIIKIKGVSEPHPTQF